MTERRVPDPGELAEDLAEIKRAVEHGARDTRAAIDALAARIESTYVRQDVYRLAHQNLEGRVKTVEDRHTWLARTSITALILPVIVTIVAAIILSGGVR